MTTPDKYPPPTDSPSPSSWHPAMSSEFSLSLSSSRNPHPPEDSIPLSALQHYLYCPRQCALIHTERLWEENIFTAKGRILHSRTETPETTVQNGIKTVHGLQVFSRSLGLYGVCDVVEFHASGPVPVEFKRGKPKSHRADEVQLCAQALCLEEIFQQEIPEGLLFYGKTRRRCPVKLDSGLRKLTVEIASACRELLISGETPPADYRHAKCAACSLLELCKPRRKKERQSVARVFAATFASEKECDS